MLYRFLRQAAMTLFRIFFGFRGYRSHRTPSTGGFVLASNHQSFLDPIILGLGLRRQIGFVARATLFRNPLFGWLIRSLGAVPIDRDRGDVGSLRSVRKALKEGRILVMFPEGTRSRDGSIGRCKAGAAITARVAGVPVVPAAIDGAHDAWPRHRSLPRPFRPVRVVYGHPITYPKGQKHAEIAADLRGRLETLLEELRVVGAGDETSG